MCGRVELFGRRSLLGGGGTNKAVVGILGGGEDLGRVERFLGDLNGGETEKLQ